MPHLRVCHRHSAAGKMTKSYHCIAILKVTCYDFIVVRRFFWHGSSLMNKMRDTAFARVPHFVTVNITLETAFAVIRDYREKFIIQLSFQVMP